MKFELKWKGFTAKGHIHSFPDGSPEEDMNMMIREDIEQQIIEHCLDEEFDYDRREKLECKLLKGLGEAQVEWTKG